MKKYNKLVRDNIADIIKAGGGVAHTKVLSDDHEYLKALTDKLIEEALEVQQTPVIEELADVLEVVQCITGQLNLSMEEVEIARQQKAKKNGSFKKRVFLESTD